MARLLIKDELEKCFKRPALLLETLIAIKHQVGPKRSKKKKKKKRPIAICRRFTRSCVLVCCRKCAASK